MPLDTAVVLFMRQQRLHLHALLPGGPVRRLGHMRILAAVRSRTLSSLSLGQRCITHVVRLVPASEALTRPPAPDRPSALPPARVVLKRLLRNTAAQTAFDQILGDQIEAPASC